MLRKWMNALRQRSKRERPAGVLEGQKTAKQGREPDVDSIVQSRQLANFWKYDGDEQTPVSREDILRQIH